MAVRCHSRRRRLRAGANSSCATAACHRFGTMRSCLPTRRKRRCEPWRTGAGVGGSGPRARASQRRYHGFTGRNRCRLSGLSRYNAALKGWRTASIAVLELRASYANSPQPGLSCTAAHILLIRRQRSARQIFCPTRSAALRTRLPRTADAMDRPRRPCPLRLAHSPQIRADGLANVLAAARC